MFFYSLFRYYWPSSKRTSLCFCDILVRIFTANIIRRVHGFNTVVECTFWKNPCYKGNSIVFNLQNEWWWQRHIIPLLKANIQCLLMHTESRSSSFIAKISNPTW